MNPPSKFSRVIGGKRYSVETATLLASDAYWDGHNYERSGTNCFLYKTPKGNYFLLNMTCWQGEGDSIQPVAESEAKEMWEQLSEKDLDYEQAFGIAPEEA